MPAVPDLAPARPSAPTPESLTAVLEAELRLVGSDRHRKASLLFELGRLEEERRGDPKAARGHYRAALEASADCLPALRGLRRLEEAAGRIAEAVRLREREIALTADDRLRSAASAELGRTHEAQGHNDQAIAAYRRSLELHGGRQETLEALVTLHESEQQWLPLSETLLRAAGNTRDKRRQALLTARAASVREALLDQEASAEALFATAMGYTPSFAHIAEELARVYRTRGRWNELAALQRAEAERAETDEVRALFLYRAGRLFADRAGDPETAETCFAEAAALAPDDDLAAAALVEAQRRRGDFEGVEATTVAGLPRIKDRRRAVATHFEIARLRADRLGRTDDAIAALKLALDRDPRDLPSLRALEDLLVEQGRFAELVDVASAEVDRLRDQDARAHAYHELGQLVERHLEQPGRAAFLYRAALDLCPDHRASLVALERLYGAERSWDALVDLLEHGAETTPDESRAAARLSRAVEIAENRLEDSTRAIALTRKLLALRADDLEAVGRLGRLLEEANEWPERVELLWREVELTTHEPERLALLMRIAALCEVRLDALERARDVYRKIIEAEPTHAGALRGLARLDRRSGRFEDLLDTLSLELQAGPPRDEAAVVHYRRGRILEEKLGRTEEALGEYRESLEKDPTYAPAWDAQERILRALSLWKDLASLLEGSARDPGNDAATRGVAWYRVGELREERLGNDKGAADAYREALKLCPEHEPARLGILRILEAQRRWAEVAGVLEAEAALRKGQRRVSALLRLADLRVTRLQDQAAALAALREAEQEAPESLAVQEALARVCRRLQDWDGLGRAYLALARSLAEPRDAAAVLHRAALDARTHPAVGDPVDLWRHILELTPEDSTALAALEDAALAAGDAELLLDVTNRRLQMESSEALRLPLLLRQAELWAQGGDLAAAAESFEGALALDDHCISALRGLSAIKAATNDFAGLAVLREREAAVLLDRESVTAALIEAGEIHLGRLARPDEALRCFARVVELAPGHRGAFHRLTSILQGRQRWQELAEAISTRLSSATDEAEETSLRIQLATLQRDSLGAHEDAIATLKGLLALDPTHRRALEMLGELYVAVERWRDAADAYLATATAAEQRAEAKVAHRARIALAELQIGRLGEHDEAVKTLTQALQRAPGDAASLRLLAVAQQKRGDPARAAAALTELADATPRGEKARILVELAELLARDADDPVGAAAALQRAAADSPGDREPMRRLEQHFAAIGDWEGLARSLAWAVDHAGGDARTTALLRVELARTLIEKQGRVAAGVEHLEAVLEAQPGNVAARFAMARRHMLPPGRPDLAEEQYRRILADDPWSLQALGELFRVLSGGKEPARAWPVAALLAYFGDADAATAAASPPPARGSLGADGYDELVREEAESRQFCRLLRTAQVTIEKVYPPDLERHGASRDDRAGPGDVLGASVVEVCKRLGVEMCETFISHRNRHVCAVEPGDPPRVVVGVGLTSYATAARRFELGRALGPIVGGGLLFQKVPRRELPALLSAIVGTVVKGYAGMGDPDEVTELTRRVSRAVPRRLRKALEEPARAAASGPLPDLDGWIAAAARSADLCGLLACGDVAAALDAVRRREESRAPTPHETPERRIAALDDYGPAEDLARYWLSPRCEKALGRLGAPPR